MRCTPVRFHPIPPQKKKKKKQATQNVPPPPNLFRSAKALGTGGRTPADQRPPLSAEGKIKPSSEFCEKIPTRCSKLQITIAGSLKVSFPEPNPGSHGGLCVSVKHNSWQLSVNRRLVRTGSTQFKAKMSHAQGRHDWLMGHGHFSS